MKAIQHNSVGRATRLVGVKPRKPSEQDFGIGIEKPEKGEIKTKRKILSAYGDAHSAAFYYKQYVIKIEEKEPGKTTVVMTPRLFHQETDISDKACWVIKGKAGEIKLWESLFKEIQEQL